MTDKAPWTVTQADRGAAAEMIRRAGAGNVPPNTLAFEVQETRLGNHDSSYEVLAFARHRHESQAELVEALREARDALDADAEQPDWCIRADMAVDRIDAVLAKIGGAA